MVKFYPLQVLTLNLVFSPFQICFYFFHHLSVKLRFIGWSQRFSGKKFWEKSRPGTGTLLYCLFSYHIF